MNKIVRGLKKIAPVIIIAGLLLNVAACSDGDKVLPQRPSYDVTPSSPSIVSFYADPEPIKVGGTTMVKWEAANANHVEISAVTVKGGTAFDFKVSGSETKGEKETPSITEDTTFTIKASNKVVENAEGSGTKPKAASGAAATSLDTQSFTVHVTDANALTVDVSADPASVFAGGQVLLKWKVISPTEVTVDVKSKPEEAIAAVADCSGSIEEIAARPAAKVVPAEGCAVVAPAEDTEYTVTATASDGTVVVGKALVAIKDEDAAKAQILVNGQETYVTDSLDSEVEVSWSVEPKTASVNISTDVAVNCQPPLYKLSSVGAAKCKLNGDTTFTLTADVNGKQVATKTARATLRGGNSVVLGFGDKWAFAGEEVVLDINVVSGNAAAISELSIGGKGLDADKLAELKKYKKTIVTVTAGKSEMLATVKYGANQSVTQTAIKVAPLNPVVVNGTVSGAAFDAKLGNYVGVERAKFETIAVKNKDDKYEPKLDLSVFFYANGVEKKAEISKSIKSAAPTVIDAFFTETVKSFPVRVTVNTTEDGKSEIYLGTSGALMHSKDDGATWKAEGLWPLRSNSGDGESHPTCGNDGAGKQKTLAGVKNTSKSSIVSSLVQVCDIIVKGNHVIVATDVGIKEKKDVNSAEGWDIPADATYGYVVNDIEEAGKYVYAASELGLYVGSINEAVKMTKINGIEGPVFAVAYDKLSNALYVGKQDGLYKLVLGAEGKAPDSASFVKVDDVNVKSSVLAIKAELDSILVGTKDGLVISRDGGANFGKLGSVSGPVSVIALDSAALSGGNMSYAAIIGAGASAFSSVIELPMPAL